MLSLAHTTIQFECVLWWISPEQHHWFTHMLHRKNFLQDSLQLTVLSSLPMPSSHIFSLPSSSGRRPAHKLLLAKGKKRKRRESEAEDEDSQDVQASPGDNLTGSFVSLNRDQASQYRLAGIEPGAELPKTPFPHREPFKSKPSSHDISGNRSFTAFLKEPEQTGLRQRHLNVLTTAIHNALLKGDYQRAGKAWAMLLRSGSSAVRLMDTTMDLCKDGQWEIGAEILLCRRRLNQHERSRARTQEQQELLQPNPEPILTQEGLRATRNFFERLIVQYPIHPNRSNTQIEFYLALFTLWIYEISERAKSERQRLMQSDGTTIQPDGFDEDSGQLDAVDRDELVTLELGQIQTNEVQGARQIANRLDDLLSLPPYDKDPRLLHLRGSIALWMGDLVENGREREQRRAQDFFHRSIVNGGRLWQAT